MKATDLLVKSDFKFNPEKGSIEFLNSRVVCFDVNAVGQLRQNLIDNLGFEEARAFFLKFGFEQGYSDFVQVKAVYEDRFESEQELLASATVVLSGEGNAYATATEISFNKTTGEFYFEGSWINSYEAEQHLTFNGTASEPVCWSLTGYLSGWCTAFFSEPLIAIETVCEGKGDDRCEWRVRPPHEWGEKATPYTQALQAYFDKIHKS